MKTLNILSLVALLISGQIISGSPGSAKLRFPRLIVGQDTSIPTGTSLYTYSTVDPVTANGGESTFLATRDMPSPGAETTAIGVQGFVKNNGSTVGTTAHHIGVAGIGEDTTAGRQTLYGIEGKVEGRGTAGSQSYVGGVMFGNFEGSAFAGTNVGVKAMGNITTDGSTPLAQGTNIGVWVPALVGGATKLGVLTYDLVGANGGLLVEDSTTGVGLLINSSSTQVFSVSATNGAITQAGVAFASLGAPANGTMIYCTDCTYGSNPCTGSSSGAIAKRINGAWRCD